ncbi:MAG TPA: alpha/beta hydrolase [Mycobacteriales bacterium]|nr:alpha/beta hydrolase [Mycobacteriales bacterium]
MPSRNLIAAAVAGAAVLSACSSSASSPSSAPVVTPSVSSSATAGLTPGASASATSGPTTLAAFDGQHLTWHECHDGLQCTSLVVPLDYTDLGGKRLHIAVIRKPASSKSEGSLIVNPGGPGASGVDFVAQESSIFNQLTTHFDLVSFDPRGVGASDPIRCLTSSQLDAYVNIDPDPTSAADRQQTITASRNFADACYRKNGSYLEHVSTLDQARDMDVLRAALGDKKLTYYGASYGTYLGAKYAQLFPTHIRAMVLDGALNPDESSTDANLVQAKGFETDLTDFLAFCVRSGHCPFGSTTSAAAAGLDHLIATITAHPLTVGSRILGAGELFEGLAAGLYSTGDWANLQAVLAAAKSGNGAGVLIFADALTERNNDGSYSNLIESNMAINCIDRPSPRSVSVYEKNAAKFQKQAPHFGAAIEYGSLPCAFWKVPPVETPHPVSAPGAPPILVIGTTRDPATPFVWAKALASQLSSGVLLTHDGDGHTAYIDRDACVDAVVSNYVLRLNPPKAGTVCH